MRVMLYPCICRVALIMDLFVLCVACSTVFVIFFGGWRCSVGYNRVWSSKECACWACDPSVNLSVPSIYIFCMSEVISSFKILRAGSQVFAFIMLFLWVIFHTL